MNHFLNDLFNSSILFTVTPHLKGSADRTLKYTRQFSDPNISIIFLLIRRVPPYYGLQRNPRASPACFKREIISLEISKSFNFFPFLRSFLEWSGGTGVSPVHLFNYFLYKARGNLPIH